MSARLLIILGDPDTASFCNTLGRTYGLAAQAHGAEVHYLHLNRLTFNPILRGADPVQPLVEPDLIEAQELIRWADHTVWAYPLSWGGMPALLKCFVDRVFAAGFAYAGRTGSPDWKPLLTGKSADVLVTVESLPWYNRFGAEVAATRQLKESVLEHCGMGPVRSFTFGPILGSSASRRGKWLARVVGVATSGLGQTLPAETAAFSGHQDVRDQQLTASPIILTTPRRAEMPADFTELVTSHVRTPLHR